MPPQRLGLIVDVYNSTPNFMEIQMQFTPLKDPRGRKPIDPSKRMSARVVSIDDETAAILRSYGNGNLSQGIRDAAKEIEKKFVKTHHDEQPKQSQC